MLGPAAAGAHYTEGAAAGNRAALGRGAAARYNGPVRASPEPDIPLAPGRLEVRHPIVLDVLVFLGLAVAVAALFTQVLDTGFWSPEDLQELDRTAKAVVAGDLLRFRPSLAGGYPTNPIFGLEFHFFRLNPRPYFAVNMLVHLLNSFLAYALIHQLLHDRRSAFLAAALFALSVGSYGKNLMIASGVSSLVYATTVLLGTLLYVLNEKRNDGRPFGIYALGFYALFLGSLFMRGGTFSLLASFTFFNIFFAVERRRPVLHVNLSVCLGLALGATLVLLWSGGRATPVPVDAGAFLRNLPGYLILMVFPLHQSELLSTAPAVVRAVYAVAPFIRILVGLTILSYSLFGFVFGSRALRYYIAWTYLMVVPFAFFRYTADWLNIRFLYLVSVGFCVLLTTGTLYGYKLLHHRRGRRLLPFAIPVFYVLLSAALVNQLDRKNEQLAQSPETVAKRARIAARLGS